MLIPQMSQTPYRWGRGSRIGLLACALLVCMSACRPSTAPLVGTQPVRVDTAWVSGMAASAVDPMTGLFRPGGSSWMVTSPASAESVAIAVARLIGSPAQGGNLRGYTEGEHGAPIDWERVRPCQRNTYSTSPVGTIPPKVPGWLRRSLSSHWAIPLCDTDGLVQVSVGVPDAVRDARIVNGALVLRQFGGGEEFDVTGVPHRFSSGLPLPPEEAVRALAIVAHVRTNEVPVAINQYDEVAGQLPLCASWRLRVDQPRFAFTSTGDSAQYTEFFARRVPTCFSNEIGIFVASLAQQSSRMVSFPKDTTSLTDDAASDSALVSLVLPTKYVRVSFR